MKLVVEIKKMRRNMITSMSGIRFNSIGSSGSDNRRRSFMWGASAFFRGETDVFGSAEFRLVHDANHESGEGLLVGLDDNLQGLFGAESFHSGPHAAEADFLAAIGNLTVRCNRKDNRVLLKLARGGRFWLIYLHARLLDEACRRDKE